MTILNMNYGGGEGGTKYGYIDLLIVGGGGGGSTYGSRPGGGGGAGGFIECCNKVINNCTLQYSITVGCGGRGSCHDGTTGCCYPCKGGYSSAFGLVACGGGIGSYNCKCVTNWCNGASGGGGANCTSGGTCITGQGNAGGNSTNNGGGGGGGAGGAGVSACCINIGGNGGTGKCSSISGKLCWYAGGGGGGKCSSSGTAGTGGTGGGGNGGYRGGSNATYYGGGGGGSCICKAGDGYQGVVILRYKTDGSCGIKNTSSGGCKYTCGDYTIHCFTSCNDVFNPVFK